MKKSGRVIKAVASRYFVDTGKETIVAFARKKIKNMDRILVGDNVDMVTEKGSYVIEKILPRKNKLIRPYVSNIDICLIVVAPVPEPDFVLVDKVIINCFVENIKPILVANKSDLSFLESLKQYDGIVETMSCSTVSMDGIEQIKDRLSGNTVCLAGQSAVGKSSLVNAILEKELLETNGLTKKIQRGKHTTRQTEIIKIEDFYLIDTCGFSMLNVVDLEPEKLKLYYDEFDQFSSECQFSSCTHINEPNCAVKEHVGKEIPTERYERYKTIYDELVERKNKKY